LVVTADDELRSSLLDLLTERGVVARSRADWPRALRELARKSTTMMLLDGELPGIDGPLAHALAAALPHEPEVLLVRGRADPLKFMTPGKKLAKLAERRCQPALSQEDLQLMKLTGLSGDPLEQIRAGAHSPLPIRIEGARGTGKMQLARTVHRIIGGDRPFVVLKPGETLSVHKRRGSVFLENVDRHTPDAVVSHLQLASAMGWRVFTGTRVPHDVDREGDGWTHWVLRPLRERPRDLRALTRFYLRIYRDRLGLPAQRVSKDLWTLMERHTWPGNRRELEAFVVQAATSARNKTLSPRSLPVRVLRMLDPRPGEVRAMAAFEQIAEERLRPLVMDYQPANGQTLHRMVLDATERALIRLALQRTGGSQKSAAKILGVARNTLRSRMERFDDA